MERKPFKTYTEERPWGNFIQFSENEPSTVKIISVKPNQALSLQLHQNRDEFWRVISGHGMITIADKEIPARQDDEFFIPRQTKHRISTSDAEIRILEIAFGDFAEDDIERFEDRYGRT